MMNRLLMGLLAVLACSMVSNVAQAADAADKLLAKYACTACHAVDKKLVGPAFKDVAAKYKAKSDAESYLSGKIRSGGSGVWGPVPMPAQTLSADEATAIAKWVMTQK